MLLEARRRLSSPCVNKNRSRMTLVMLPLLSKSPRPRKSYDGLSHFGASGLRSPRANARLMDQPLVTKIDCCRPSRVVRVLKSNRKHLLSRNTSSAGILAVLLCNFANDRNKTPGHLRRTRIRRFVHSMCERDMNTHPGAVKPTRKKY